VTRDSIRADIYEALLAASVPALSEHPLVPAFLAGTGDIAFDDLEMDSLSRMEFCISIELNCDVSIVPETLETLTSLSDVVRLLESHL
jgi:hypothetical protein